MFRVLKAFLYSSQGLWAALRYETAFRQEFLVFLILVPVAFFATPVWFERLVLLGSWLLVMMFELINSGLEQVCDAITLEKKDWIKKVKDYGSAAVLLSMMLAFGLWFVVLVPQFI